MFSAPHNFVPFLLGSSQSSTNYGHEYRKRMTLSNRRNIRRPHKLHDSTQNFMIANNIPKLASGPLKSLKWSKTVRCL